MGAPPTQEPSWGGNVCKIGEIREGKKEKGKGKKEGEGKKKGREKLEKGRKEERRKERSHKKKRKYKHDLTFAVLKVKNLRRAAVNLCL